MADSTLSIEGAASFFEDLVRDGLTAGTRSVARTARELEHAIEAAVEGAVPGKLWAAVMSRGYPGSGGPAREPSAIVGLNGGRHTVGAFEYFTQPGRITPGGKFLAVPLPAAGRGKQDPDKPFGPKDWEAVHGPLRLIWRRGRPPLLVADSAVIGAGGKARIKGLKSKAAQKRGYAARSSTVPIFVLIPFTDHDNRVSIDHLIAAAAGDIEENYFAELRSSSTKTAGRVFADRKRTHS